MLTNKIFNYIIESDKIFEIYNFSKKKGIFILELAMNFLRALSGLRSPFADTFFQLITRLGEEVIVLGVICLLYWCINKNAAYKLGLIFFTSGIAVQGLKVSFRIERPWVIDPSFQPVESAKAAATGYSFPSGHTQGATALYGYFAVNTKNRIICVIMSLLILAVGFSRMYLGVHTPYDVVVSLVITFISVILINRFYETLAAKEHILSLSIVLGAVSVALCIYSFVLACLGYIETAQINDCFKSGGAGLGFAAGLYIERRFIDFDVRTKKIYTQVLKLLCGVAGALLFKELIKLIAPGNLIIDFVRYFVTVMWVLVLYPLIIKKLSGKREEA